MSKVKIVASSLFYTTLIVILIWSMTYLMPSDMYDTKRIVLLFIALLLAFLFLKFNIINYQPISQKRISKVFPLLALLATIFVNYYYRPHYIFFDDLSIILICILTSFFVGVIEELFFRGILYNLFYYNKIVYLLSSSFIFGFLHYGNGLLSMVISFFIGLALTIVRLTETPLWVLILIHTLINIPLEISANYSITSSTHNNFLNLFSFAVIIVYTIIIFLLYIDTKGIWKSNFEGEKLESKSLIDYLGS